VASEPHGSRRGRQGIFALIASKVIVFAVYVVFLCNADPTTNRVAPVALALVVVVLIAASMAMVFTDRFQEQLLGVRIGVVFIDLATLVTAFSTAYLLLSGNSAEIKGISTGVDALYFTSTVLTTAGFGDITPDGQYARTLVTVQMLFGFTYLAVILAAAASAITKAPDRSQL
jgi:hypothetical protein